MNMARHLEELSRAVGDATLACAKAEHLLGGLILGLAESEEVHFIGKPGRPMGQLIKEARRLLGDRDDLGTRRAHADSLLDDLNALKDKRNRLIHDAVIVHPIREGETTPRFDRLSSAWGSHPSIEPFEVSELCEIAAELERASMARAMWSHDNLPYIRA
nr:hypothetical protein GCM10025732_55560 [Glycomyces mayteni]